MGVPTSRPMRDPDNHESVYLRLQRGTMMFDGATGLTQGLLLGDMLKGVITGEHLPVDLEEQARGSRLHKQFAPGQPGWVRGPVLLPATDLTLICKPNQPTNCFYGIIRESFACPAGLSRRAMIDFCAAAGIGERPAEVYRRPR